MTENMDDSSSNPDETLMNEEELSEFTSNLDQFKPVIPETVTQYYMNQAGLQTDDERVVKLISVSVQKFMTNVINDCFQLHKLREKSNNRSAATASSAPAATNTHASSSATTEPITATSTDPLASGAIAKKPAATTNSTLTLNELTHVLDEYGINVKKTFYYT